ncbi:MAG: cytochrome P450 [Paracoccaceae bacterium]|nr:cytochrome P450 [Paracoccaceae bacterium]
MTNPHSLSRPLRFDIESAAFKRDPGPTLAAMRAAGPVIPMRLPFIGRTWVTTTHAATGTMLKDKAGFVRESRNAGRTGIAGMRWWMPRSLKLLTENMLMKDEPDHRRLRKLVDGAFQRRGVQAMRGRIEALADTMLDGIEADIRATGSADLVEGYARRLPLEVICELLGLPDQDRGEFAHWTKVGTGMTSAWGFFRALRALKKLIRYVRDQIEACRRAPRPGLITELLREEDGDRLSEAELISMVFLLLIAGFETTTHLIATSVVALNRHPGQRAWLMADPSARIERAVEELARYTTPVQMTKPRYVARDLELEGQALRRGELITGFLASANHDAEVFEAPGELRLDRFPNPHLVFGSGIHFCLGMQLARVEVQAALTRLYGRLPDLVLPDDHELDWIERLGLRGVASLPVRPAKVALGENHRGR